MDRRDNDQSPAKLYAGIVGATLVVAGIIGFFYNAEFTSDKSVRDAVECVVVVVEDDHAPGRIEIAARIAGTRLPDRCHRRRAHRAGR